MRRVLYVLLASILVIAVVWLVAALPGRVVAQVGDTTVEAGTAIFVLGLILLLAILLIVIRIIAAVWRAPRAARWWREARHRRLGDRALTRTLLALAAGAKGDARREAGRARRLLGKSPQTLLLVAEAGRMAGRDDEAEAAFRRLTERPDAAFLGFRGLLRQAMAREDWGEAAALARQAEAAQPGAAWLREMRRQLAVRAGDWPEALRLADDEASRAALGAAAADTEPDAPQALSLARLAWKADPSLAAAALAYARRLRATGRENRALATIRHSWSIAPHPDLATFALAPLEDSLARARAAQRLADANPTDAESRLLVARMALAAGLTGEARRQAEAALAAGVNERRLWLLLADIEEAEHGATEAGRLAQTEALRRAAIADPDPTWRCVSCHVASAAWHAACPNCGTTGGLRWTRTVSPATVPAVVA